ncbi:MAG: DUF1275 domain-containing protein [Lachnospiraceae bacterium]|nr:DUF1275 domain-containing protein [Solobacterium sp.]MBR6155357.1 DUF1275 domain-containing protein [Lachnospiraceae bacterium]
MAMNPDQRGSRTFVTAVLLALTGGYLDAYTYFVRGKVFANAQTGNIIKLGIFAAQGEFSRCMDFLFPILAFCLGVLCSLLIENYFERQGKPYSRRGVLLVEILCMIVIAFLPNTEFFDICSNILVSFLCAMQMQTFQIFHKKVIATTVGTGNLRKGVEFLYHAIRKKDTANLQASGEFFFILLMFVGGVILGTLISEYLSIRSILVPAALLALAIVHITAVYHRYLKEQA